MADTWTPEQVAAWIERHGGNVSALARRLRVARTKLQEWKRGTRALPRYVQAHMETLDRYETAA